MGLPDWVGLGSKFVANRTGGRSCSFHELHRYPDVNVRAVRAAGSWHGIRAGAARTPRPRDNVVTPPAKRQTEGHRCRRGARSASRRAEKGSGRQAARGRAHATRRDRPIRPRRARAQAQAQPSVPVRRCPCSGAPPAAAPRLVCRPRAAGDAGQRSWVARYPVAAQPCPRRWRRGDKRQAPLR